MEGKIKFIRLDGITMDAGPVRRLFNIFDQLKTLTAATPKTLEGRMLKMTNEMGELAQAVDIHIGNPGTKYREATDTVNDMLEEAVDVSLVVQSFILQLQSTYGLTDDQILAMYELKQQKWQRVLELDTAE